MAKLNDELITDDCWNQIGVWRRSDEICPKLEKIFHCHNCDIYSDAGRKLLDRRYHSDYKNEWVEIYASEKEVQKSHDYSALIFRLGDEVLALSTRLFTEIIEMREIHSIPHHADRLLRGLVNIRGEMLICVSLGTLLGLGKSQKDYTTVTERSFKRLAIIKSDDAGAFVFPISDALGIYHFDSKEINQPPTTISKTATSYISGTISWKTYTVGCLDPDLLISVLSRNIV